MPISVMAGILAEAEAITLRVPGRCVPNGNGLAVIWVGSWVDARGSGWLLGDWVAWSVHQRQEHRKIRPKQIVAAHPMETVSKNIVPTVVCGCILLDTAPPSIPCSLAMKRPASP